MKLYKKIAMYALVATLSLGTFGVLSLSAKGANGDYDGDIIRQVNFDPILSDLRQWLQES